MVKIGEKIKTLVRNDPNLPRLRRGVVKGIHGVRAGTGTYLVDKIPIARWIAGYRPKWIIGDAIAGTSVGLIIIPQAVLLAAIAGVPLKAALLASWLPGILYSIVGTSRDISVGPTTVTSTFTATVVAGLAAKRVPAVLAPAALSFSVAMWSFIFGIFNLGFIFEIISMPIALGFLVGTGIVVATLQLPLMLGIVGLDPKFTTLMIAIMKGIKSARPETLGLAAASIAILAALQFIGGKWGKKNEYIQIFCTCRHILVMATFTALSFFFNKDLAFPLWSVVGETKTTITTVLLPQVPIPLLNFQIVSGVFLPSFILFFSIALEHIATSKAYGHLGGYSTSASQEMFALGVINLAQCSFGALPVGGGDLTRTSINVSSGANTPLAGIFTSIVVFASFFFFSDAIKFLPTAVAAAVIFMAVIDKMPSQKLFATYWKTSFIDFLQFLLALNGTLLTTGESGMGVAAVFMMGYTLFRLMFSRPSSVLAPDLEHASIRDNGAWWMGDTRLASEIPSGMQVVHVETDAVSLNATRIKRHIIDTVLMTSSGLPYSAKLNERPWNYRLDKHIESVRKRGGVSKVDNFLPYLRVLILDLSQTSFVDADGVRVLMEIKNEVRAFAGRDVEIRFVGVNDAVKRRFERMGWKLGNPYEDAPEGQTSIEDDVAKLIVEEEKVDFAFDSLSHAVLFQGAFEGAVGGREGLYKDVSITRVNGLDTFEMNVI